MKALDRGHGSLGRSVCVCGTLAVCVCVCVRWCDWAAHSCSGHLRWQRRFLFPFSAPLFPEKQKQKRELTLAILKASVSPAVSAVLLFLPLPLFSPHLPPHPSLSLTHTHTQTHPHIYIQTFINRYALKKKNSYTPVHHRSVFWPDILCLFHRQDSRGGGEALSAEGPQSPRGGEKLLFC